MTSSLVNFLNSLNIGFFLVILPLFLALIFVSKTDYIKRIS